MIVCKQCLEAIESHEGHQKKIDARDSNCEVKQGCLDNNGNLIEDEFFIEGDFVWCEWCQQWELIENCYEI